MGRDVAKEQALRQAELIKDAVSRIIHNEMPEQQQPDTDTWAGLQVLKKLRLSHNSS
jgi:hypothetical protein